MNQRFIMFPRKGIYYCEDKTTGKQTSLRTRDEAEAITLLHAKNESFRQPVLNLQIARTYLTACDPVLSERTWQHVMKQIISTKTDNTLERWQHLHDRTDFWNVVISRDGYVATRNQAPAFKQADFHAALDVHLGNNR